MSFATTVRRRDCSRFVRAGAAVPLAVASWATPVRGNYVVSNTADSGAGSLRQAILSANADPSGLPVSIDFTATGTDVLNSSLPPLLYRYGLNVNGPVGVDGGPAFTVNANGNRGLFVYATDPQQMTTNGPVSISNLAVTNAVANGGTGGTGDLAGVAGLGWGRAYLSVAGPSR